MSSIDLRIEKWKSKLLDLGKRNRLINYRDTKRSNIKIVFPEIYELYKSLVVDEDTLKFPCPVNNGFTDIDDNSESAVIVGDIRTGRTIKEQQKTLRYLRSKAKTALEEQGVNILYLSFGFLKWKESQSSEQSIISPLILVPVTLSIESITAPFEISLYEDEITLNPTLSHKLEVDFGVNLPVFDSSDERIDTFLSSINALALNNGMEVLYESGLSLFSFLKINMYKDLEKNKEVIKAHPIVKALSGDITDVKLPSDELNNYDHDEKIRPIDTYQVLDADSTQQDAILYVKKGLSFVLQGPPGTGKSQTITNIIAESLADGKRVLFVSEKMAALEVVYKRLSQSGLSDYCLTLHSHKANKKEVLNELGKVLNLNKFKMQDEALYQLELLTSEKEKLNQYDSQLHTSCPPLNKSIFEINGRLAKLNDAPNLIFSIKNIKNTTSQNLNQYIYLIEDLTRTMGKMSEDYSANPWRNCNVPSVTHELRHDIGTHLGDLGPKLKDFSNLFKSTTIKFGLEVPFNINGLIGLFEILEVSSKSPKIPVDWIDLEDINPLLQQAEKFRSLKAELGALYTQLSQKYTINFFNLAPIIEREKFNLLMKEARQVLSVSIYREEAEITNSLEKSITLLETSRNNIASLKTQSDTVIGQLGALPVVNIKAAFALIEFLECLQLSPNPVREWFDIDKFNLAKQLMREAKRVFSELEKNTTNMTSKFDKEILDLDSLAMLKRFKNEYTTVFKVFKRDYRADTRSIKLLSKEKTRKFDDASIITVLIALNTIKELISWVTENQDSMASLFGDYYHEELTDWTAIEREFFNFERIIAYFGLNPISLQTKNYLLRERPTNSEYKVSYEKIKIILDSGFYLELNQNFCLPEKAELIYFDNFMPILVSASTRLKNLFSELGIARSYCKQEMVISDLVESFNKLERLQTIARQIEIEGDSLRSSFKFLFKGINTNWEVILNSLLWTGNFRQIILKFTLPRPFIERICSDDASISFAVDRLEEIKRCVNDFEKAWKWYLSLFDDINGFYNTDFDELAVRIEKGRNNLSSLEEWIDFRTGREKCKNAGLEDFIKTIEQEKLEKNLILPAFLKRFYRLWLDVILPNYPAVASFRRLSQETIIQEFRRLDTAQIKIAQKRVQERLVSKLPDMNRLTSAVDEVAILRRELNKQRKIMPLRKLFRAIPHLLLTLKPCFMMSPLSVSLFLEDVNYKFDVVIFDEASQVCTEDAIGAIMRGGQVVIAGDIKQLPPSSFFIKTTSDNEFDTDDCDEDEEDDTDAYESILDEAVTVLPQSTLRWHYRSRHEHLIAFSNAKIYENSLITFPSPLDIATGNGVEYIYVPDGIYDRGGKKNNIIEAKKVADLVFQHIAKYPNRSLGVVTFGEAQQEAVEASIRLLRFKNQQCEDFFSEDKEEAFFIKNLENVQGDERDTIIISIGYGKDQNGVMYMTLGPLIKTGGFRRLNVAITRAKYNVKLVGSIQPTDIRVEDTTSKGVKMLRSYIEFAKMGPAIFQKELTIPEVVNTESPFEEAVYDFIVSKGFRVITQVGCSGYRIDMAVCHPTLNGRFVLGIECDGATYHSARTARERDRLRQSVLEDIGWNIYRIWSTDWIKDPVSEGQKLIEAIKRTIEEYPKEDSNVWVKNLDSEIRTRNLDTKSLIVETPTNEVSTFDNDSNPYNFLIYQETNVSEISRQPKESDTEFIANVIRIVIKNEYPIHSELLYRRLTSLYGYQKATNLIRNNVDRVLSRTLLNEIENREGFFWPKGEQRVTVRIPFKGEGIRHINMISIEEIAEAIYLIASKSFGITERDIYIATARAFGFNRTGKIILDRLESACKYLIETGRTNNSDGKIIAVV